MASNISGFELVNTEDKGRCLKATRSFRKDDVIFEESPLISCQFPWNAFYGYLSCHHCLRPLETAEQCARRLANDSSITLPYPEQCGVLRTRERQRKCEECGILYCSEECRLEAFKKYHETLCRLRAPLEGLLEIWRNCHFPPETCSIMLIARIFAMVCQAGNPQDILSTLKEFQCQAVCDSICHKILGEKFTEQLTRLHECMAGIFVEPVYQELLLPDNFKALFVLVGRNGQGIGTSSFAAWQRNTELANVDDRATLENDIEALYDKFEEFSGGFLDVEGSGLYVVQSKLNHSCLPNAEIKFPHSNHRLVISALRDIAPGEEICISYLSECLLNRSRHTRHKFLRDNYLFACTCGLCTSQAGDPDVTSSEEEDEEEDEGMRDGNQDASKADDAMEALNINL
ncbi:histone-lysine N-trimethyltransferase SMYD5 [Phlebotomus argentipes]|uniref:histone-lysine N-trimethyltransferase SMYD5 n=1 Tax=Phlebotomus argentipes TaxID=94469 RepID=UPI002892F777|nr:histone-lysine N-trimethyltransferase SMYD5 [Phlebotomus argentipes]